MNPFKSLTVAIFAVALGASLVGNIYLKSKVRDLSDNPEVRFITTDDPVVMRTKGGLLEVSTIESQERFESSIANSILGIQFSKTVTRISVPAVFRYHIELAPEWKILLRDKTFIVVAPPVKPSLPVAINTAGLQKESLGSWSPISGESQRDKLQSSITAALAIKAASPKYIQLQREIARKTVMEFVTKWLITQEEWKSAKAYPVRVFFSDEPIQALGKAPLPFVALN
jgi:hypothetical protein